MSAGRELPADEQRQVYEVFLTLTRQASDQAAVELLRSLAADGVAFTSITNGAGNSLLVTA